MISVYNEDSNPKPRPITSTHGRVLLNELSLPFIPDTDLGLANQIREKLAKCLDFVKIDKNACVLRLSASGNTAYHLLLGQDYPEQFIHPLLDAFYKANHSGLSMKVFPCYRNLIGCHLSMI